MARKNLGAPVYAVPEGADLDGDIIDVEEVVEEVPRRMRPKGAQERAEARQERAQQRARNAQERAQNKAESQARRQDGVGMTARPAGPNVPRNSPAAQLRRDTEKAAADYTQALRREQILVAGQTKASRAHKMSELHDAYTAMMVFSAVKPLQNGLRAEAVLSTIGMGASMWMLSPNFRDKVGDFAGQMKDAIIKRMGPDGRALRKGEKAGRLLDSNNPLRKIDPRRAAWKKRLEKMEFVERGHRMPFTAQSAALTQIGMSENAYYAMRQPGADVEKIQSMYSEAISSLYDMAQDDGVSRDEISTQMRLNVGRRMEAEPHLSSVFTELGHGTYVKGEPQDVVLPDGTVTKAWKADFVETRTGAVANRGSFSVRPPMSQVEHMAMVKASIMGDMQGAVLRSGNKGAAALGQDPTALSDLNNRLTDYFAGGVVVTDPTKVKGVEDPDRRARFSRIATMTESMAQDGVTKEQAKTIYDVAFVEAMQEFGELYPELGEAWNKAYGEDLSANVAAAGKDYGAEAPTPGSMRPESMQEAEDVMDAEIVLDEEEEVPEAAEERPAHHEHTPTEPIDVSFEEQAKQASRKEPGDRVFMADAAGGVGEGRVFSMAPLRRAELGAAEPLAPAPSDSAETLREKVRAMRAEIAARGVRTPRQEMFDRISGRVASVMVNDARRDNGLKPGENTWVDAHVTRSRSRALGAWDPSTPSGAMMAKEFEKDPRGLEKVWAHEPWEGDQKANDLAQSMVAESLEMTKLGIVPAEQDRIHAAAYVRGLEMAVANEPKLAEVLVKRAAVEGRSDQDWRESEFAKAMSNSRTGLGESTYESFHQALIFDDGSARVLPDHHESSTSDGRDVAAHEAATRRARRARINQQYNEAETGANLGVGADNAQILQDPGWELGN